MSLPVIHYFTLQDFLDDLPTPPCKVCAELVEEEISRARGVHISRHAICSILRVIAPGSHIGSLLIPHSTHERYNGNPPKSLEDAWRQAEAWHNQILDAADEVVVVRNGLIGIGSEKAVMGKSWLRQQGADGEEE